MYNKIIQKFLNNNDILILCCLVLKILNISTIYTLISYGLIISIIIISLSLIENSKNLFQTFYIDRNELLYNAYKIKFRYKTTLYILLLFLFLILFPINFLPINIYMFLLGILFGISIKVKINLMYMLLGYNIYEIQKNNNYYVISRKNIIDLVKDKNNIVCMVKLTNNPDIYVVY